jgi:hypothetical protein
MLAKSAVIMPMPNDIDKNNAFLKRPIPENEESSNGEEAEKPENKAVA